jgi:hypothetical protein
MIQHGSERSRGLQSPSGTILFLFLHFCNLVDAEVEDHMTVGGGCGDPNLGSLILLEVLINCSFVLVFC